MRHQDTFGWPFDEDGAVSEEQVAMRRLQVASDELRSVRDWTESLRKIHYTTPVWNRTLFTAAAEVAQGCKLHFMRDMARMVLTTSCVRR